MATNYTSLKLSYDAAARFKEDFSSSDHSSIKYVFIGNSNSYENEDTEIPEIIDSPKDEKSVWDTMFAAKRVTGNDIEFVIPRIDWQEGRRFMQFDDTLPLELLLTGDPENDIFPMYTITDEGNVYKCLCNNVSTEAGSIVKPTGDYSTANGFIFTTNESNEDCYLWKYMYNVKDFNKFKTNDWIPSPSSVKFTDYNTNNTNVIDGALVKIITTNRGSGYVDSTVNASSFVAGTSVLTIDDTTNVRENMSVIGTGIPGRTFITNVDSIFNTITLSLPTISLGGTTSNPLTIKTRIVIVGDGNDDALAEARIIEDGQIEKISITSIGTNYTRANVEIYGTGTDAEARVVLGPKFGHGFNPAKELGGTNIMIVKKFGEIDSTENGLLSTETSFRQYGLLSSPHKYDELTAISDEDAESTISQTYDVTLVPGSPYELNEVVYQGSSLETSNFSGIVHAEKTDENIVKLINVKGTIIPGLTLNGSATIRAVISIQKPKFEPYSGDILYIENANPVFRTEGQSENVKFVVKF
jgi:hypothetical protein